MNSPIESACQVKFAIVFIGYGGKEGIVLNVIIYCKVYEFAVTLKIKFWFDWETTLEEIKSLKTPSVKVLNGVIEMFGVLKLRSVISPNV